MTLTRHEIMLVLQNKYTQKYNIAESAFHTHLNEIILSGEGTSQNLHFKNIDRWIQSMVRAKECRDMITSLMEIQPRHIRCETS